MVSIKGLFLSSLLIVSGVSAIPTATVSEATTANTLERRKNPNKCEVHFHIDSSDRFGPKSTYTDKWAINIIDQPGNVMGYDWSWTNLGQWRADNPDYFIKIRTTKGLELWVDGVRYKSLYDYPYEDIRTVLTIHYGSQHFNGLSCENWLYKPARPSNGYRQERDIWCEFDC